MVSIFVNPIAVQRSEGSRTLPAHSRSQDLALLESLGADEVFAPAAAELYPHGYRFRVELDAADALMEGAHRPGFLQGVMTIVLKLLNLVRADRAYFGEKDYQQLQTVTEMAREFFIPTEIVACPTVREESGLAMSSRNCCSRPQAREKAARLCSAP